MSIEMSMFLDRLESFVIDRNNNKPINKIAAYLDLDENGKKALEQTYYCLSDGYKQKAAEDKRVLRLFTSTFDTITLSKYTDDKKYIYDVINSGILDQQELEFMQMYLGINGNEPMSYDEIATKLGTNKKKIFETRQHVIKKYKERIKEIEK